MEGWLTSCYRTILSSLSKANSKQQNMLLLTELNDTFPDLMLEAYELIAGDKVTKYQLCLDSTSEESGNNPNQNAPHFYVVYDKHRPYYAINGFCNCPRFRDQVLIKDKEFTCVHEIATYILNYCDPNLDEFINKVFQKTVYLSDLEYHKKLKQMTKF